MRILPKINDAIPIKSVFTAMLLLFCCTACDPKRVYDSYVSIPNHSWEKETPVHFSFAIEDTMQKNNLFIQIRNNQEYPFSNLFLITQLSFPKGEKVLDTLEYEMATADGALLGSGLSDVKDSKLFYKEDVSFPTAGTYTLRIVQAMRKNGAVDGLKTLPGITHVGFRIEKETDQ